MDVVALFITPRRSQPPPLVISWLLPDRPALLQCLAFPQASRSVELVRSFQ
jgi:hypothetical protein